MTVFEIGNQVILTSQNNPIVDKRIIMQVHDISELGIECVWHNDLGNLQKEKFRPSELYKIERPEKQ